MGKFCANCGNNIEEGASFCGKCGSSIGTTGNVIVNNNNMLPTHGIITAGFVLGIVGLITYFTLVPSILAVIFSLNGLKKVKEGTSAGKGLAMAGLIMGCISLGLFVLGLLSCSCFLCAGISDIFY